MTSSKTVRKAVLVQVLVLLCLAPGIVLFATGFTGAGELWILPSLAGLLAAIAAPRKILVACAVGLGIGGMLSVPAYDRPWLAALVMFVAAGGIGLTARLGISGTLATVSITMAFAVAEPTVFNHGIEGVGASVATGAVLFAAFAWAAILTLLATRHLKLKPKEGASLARSLGFALVLGLEVAIGAWFVSYFKLGHAGAWIMLTSIVILQPTLSGSWTKSLHRAIGTVAGVLIAIVVSIVVPWTWLIIILAIACLYLAVMFLGVWHAPYWRYVTSLTVAIVLLEGFSTSIEDTAINRLWASLVGAGGALLTIAIIYPLLNRRQKQVAARSTTPPAAAA